MLGKAGKTGSLYKSLKAIADQGSPRVLVIRVPEAHDKSEKNQSKLIIGGTDEDGKYTGMYAFLTAEQKTGLRPRILAVPDFDTQEVTASLCTIAQQLHAFAYAGCHHCKTMQEALTYRKQFACRELMLIWPDFIAYNPVTGKNDVFPASAYACGVRALTDSKEGWHKSLSNIGVNNVSGITHDVFWSLQAEDSDAGELFAMQKYITNAGNTRNIDIFFEQLTHKLPQHGDTILTIAKQLMKKGKKEEGIQQSEAVLHELFRDFNLDDDMRDRLMAACKQKINTPHDD